jgi:putative DNA methylase
MTIKKKLIEVALPLEAINKESAREKSIRHGHPSTLHLWWARRPLAACRAVLFASLVDDPSSHPEQFPTEEKQNEERQRLFRIIEDLVKWENSTNEKVLSQARAEIMRSCNGNPPPVLDPFCGGGSIPLEAQRLGLEAHGSDLNPVAVLITKALIEIPPKFTNMSPVNPEAREKYLASKTWQGAQGLAEDVRYYGKWMRDEAEKRIGHLYPKVQLPAEYGGGEATVIAWLWARTVKCPNPACGAMMPLIKSFVLSTKKGKESWINPIIDKQTKKITFEVRKNKGEIFEETVNRRGAKCIVCTNPLSLDYIRSEGREGRIYAQLIAIVAEGFDGRSYLSPNKQHIDAALMEIPTWKPQPDLPDNTRDIRPQLYGMHTYGDLFSSRQLVALNTFSYLLDIINKKILEHVSLIKNLPDQINTKSNILSYAVAITTYCAFALDKSADYWSTVCSWHSGRDTIRNTFARQGIPMTWDFAETNPFSSSTGNFFGAVDWIIKVIEKCPTQSVGFVRQIDITSNNKSFQNNILISTDPPYYDNIVYSDLSDFFYVWLRHCLSEYYPELFSTMLVPKAAELVAASYRFGGDKKKAQEFFEDGLSKAFLQMYSLQNPNFPLTVYYAFKQSESDEDNLDSQNVAIASTGWETMLEGLIKNGFTIDGTWPMRTELANRSVGLGSNALASSIVLVCRPRSEDAKPATRRDFLNALKKELPDALKKLQQGNIAPVDLAQASIGPGMAIYSRYSQVLESDGKPMPVRTALALINQALDEYLSEQEGEFDADTRWALAWFETVGMEEGAFGQAETLSKAKNTGIDGLKKAGILEAKGGKVRLLRREELLKDWDPATDKRITSWEATQYLIRAIDEKGETGAAQLLNKLGGLGDVARDLAYRLYSICERKKWAQEAMAYNGLVIAWPEIVKLASQSKPPIEEQPSLF